MTLDPLIRSLLLLPVWLGIAFPAAADSIRLMPARDMLTAEAVSNPRPAPGDVELPMPGGLAMVLRPVCVPASGWLDMAEIHLGVEEAGTGGDESGAENAYAESRYRTTLSGPFSPADLPAVWGDAARMPLDDPACAPAEGGPLRPYIYFIGKYEVSRAQWRAVMDLPENTEDEPLPLEMDDFRPATALSWFDAQEFTRRYSEWLMRFHPEYLPFFREERRSSFIRLPTETEWEYAARGGHKVSPTERERTRLHPAPAQADMKDYIVASCYDATLDACAPIGSRLPNPAGLHDMFGNCAEMVLTPFQLVTTGAPAGACGGFVIKGGGWRAASPLHLHPGRRLEAAYYVDGAAQSRDDLGFRVALGGLLTPRDRREQLLEEWRHRTRADAAGLDPARDDVRVVIREVGREVENPELRRRLAEAEATASRYHEQVNANEDRMARELVTGAVFSLETLANYASRCYQLIALREAYGTLGRAPSDADRDPARETARMDREIRAFIEGMRGVLFYYRGMLESGTRYHSERLRTQVARVAVDFAHEDGFSRRLRKRLDVVESHLKRATTGMGEWSAERRLLDDALPPWLMVKLEPWLDGGLPDAGNDPARAAAPPHLDSEGESS